LRVGVNDRLLDGAHRVACALALRLPEIWQVKNPREELLAAELSFINTLKEAVVEKSLEFPQIDRLIRLHERTSKLLGLEAPTKIAETNPDGTAIDHTTPDQKREQIVQRMWLGEDTEAKYGRDRSAISAAPAGDDGGTPESSRA
jgi:hypothetical protein